MLVGGILVGLGLLGLVIVHFRLLDQLFGEPKAKQPPDTIKRK